MKPVVKYVSTKENNFVDHYFLLSGIPINTHNTIVLMESLNSTSSKYSDAAFNPSAEDSETYKISFRATNHSQV